MGIVPQCNHQPQIIIDYTWRGINPADMQLALDLMRFDRALQQILQKNYDADPKHGQVYLIKVYISDSFYRIQITAAGIPTLGIALPPGPGSSNW